MQLRVVDVPLHPDIKTANLHDHPILTGSSARRRFTRDVRRRAQLSVFRCNELDTRAPLIGPDGRRDATASGGAMMPPDSHQALVVARGHGLDDGARAS